ncbi:MAG: hypothetical protein JWM75_2482, partial [Sphingomonas bacterium]|nr:hypothetical protein [Sphingomonas bacterium]
MRAPGPPVRFLIGVIALWSGVRAAMLIDWNGAVEPVLIAARTSATRAQPRGPEPAPIAFADVRSSAIVARHLYPQALERRPGHVLLAPMRVAATQVPFMSAGGAARSREATQMPPPAHPPEPPSALAAAVPLPPPSAVTRARRWSGSVWVYRRDGGGGTTLAGGGQLGESQAGGRIAYALDDGGRLAVAARLYSPLRNARGAEAAAGIDWRPIADVPFRLSIERRVAIGREGRDAWSAYAAGGFFRGLGRTIELDGYGQAGIVGVHARDLFVDGAMRIARRVPLAGRSVLLVGAGAWGAAQP